MTNHIIVYEGLVSASLAVLTPDYGQSIVEGINRGDGIDGTRQRGPYTPADFDSWMKRLSSGPSRAEVFAVLRHTGEGEERAYSYVGNTGVHDIEWPAGHGTSGSMLFSGADRGAGIGTEAKLWLLYHSFRMLGLRKVNSVIKAFNGPSLGHLLKCGYNVVGRRKAHDIHQGGYVDEILLEVFVDEWLPVWTAYRETRTLPHLSEAQRIEVKKLTAPS